LVPRTLTTPLPNLPSTLHPIQMAFNNNIDSNSRSSSSTQHGPNGRLPSLLEVVLGNDEPNPGASTSYRGMDTRSGYTVVPPRSLGVEASFGKSGRSPFDDRCSLIHEFSDPMPPAMVGGRLAITSRGQHRIRGSRGYRICGLVAMVTIFQGAATNRWLIDLPVHRAVVPRGR
jgi:hypothetical protein